MAYKIKDIYPSQVSTGDAGWPDGKPRNIQGGIQGTGTPFEEKLFQDYEGSRQALFAEAGIDPSGVSDKVGQSDYVDALKGFEKPASSVVTSEGNNIEDFINSTKVNYPFKSATEVDIAIVYGQSGARGFANNTAGDLAYESPLAKVWDGSGVIDLTSYTPTQNGGTSTGSAWKAFGNRYTQETSRQVIIANCARGSQSITDLSKGQANTNYSGMVDWVADIKSYITSNGGTVGKVFVVFHQGERDSQLETTKLDYESLLTTLWDDIKADTGAETFFLCPVGYYASGQQKIYAFAIQAAQRNLAATVYDIQNCWDDMESMGEYKPDGVHLNQLGNNYMGDEIAKNVVDSLFNQNVAANIETIKRKGAPNMDGSQDWKVFGGWITKEGSDWVVTNGTSRASCYVVSVIAEVDHLAVTLSEEVDYIFGGYVHSLEKASRASVDGRFDWQAYENVDSEGRTVLKIYLETPVSLIVDTDAETISTSIPDSSIAGMMTATFGTGSCSLTHPYSPSPAVACDRSGIDNDAVLVSCNSFETATTIRLRNPIPDETTGNIVRKEGKVTVNWPRMRLNPQLMADGSELTFSMTASKKSPF